MKYKIINLINSGDRGSVFKIKIGSKYYALRREKILEMEAIELSENLKNNKLLEFTERENNSDKSNIYRLIYFNQIINKINNNHFTKYYDYEIKKCKFEHQLTDNIKNNPRLYEMYKERKKSKYCIDIITDLKDGNIYEIIDKLSKKQIYSLIIQLTYALNLMHINGFYHMDLFRGNICYKKTTISTLKIFDLDIPTFGYLYSIIDYETCQNINFRLNSNEIYNITIGDTKYYENFCILYNIFFNRDENIIKQFSLILHKDYLINKDLIDKNLFENKILNFNETINYLKNLNNAKKIIKYFSKKII